MKAVTPDLIRGPERHRPKGFFDDTPCSASAHLWTPDRVRADDAEWELVATPGHRFLRPDGSFAAIADIVAADGRIVHADGSVIAVEAERIVFSQDTAHLYERHAMLKTWTSGGLAMAA